MTSRTVFALVALVLGVGVGAAAGCGGGGRSHGSATTAATSAMATETAVVTTTASGVKPGAARACRQLNAAAKTAVGRVGSTLAGLKTVKSTRSLDAYVGRLRAELGSSVARIDAIQTPPGKLTRDREQLASSLSELSKQLQQARKAAKAGRIGSAATEFSSAAQLTKLREATQALGRDCPRVP